MIAVGAVLPITMLGAAAKGDESSVSWTAFAAQSAAAFIGAAFAFAFALLLARRARVSERTAAMIQEFSSREMLQSRFVTTNIAYQVRDGSVTLRNVALSSVQDCPVGFEGARVGDLTEHQHMSHLIGWIRRLVVHLSYGWVNRRIVAATLGGSLQWTLPFLLELADEAESVVADFPSARPIELRASWVFAVRNLDERLRRERLHRHVPGRRRRIW
jgi:hypothetical protein